MSRTMTGVCGAVDGSSWPVPQGIPEWVTTSILVLGLEEPVGLKKAGHGRMKVMPRADIR